MTIALRERSELLRHARASIEAGLRTGRMAAQPALASATLSERRATFVTLKRGDELRGCCGSIEPRFTLADDVWRNAWASAFADPRFSALEASEYPEVHLHISVLTPPQRLPLVDEADLLAALRPGVDGLVLEMGASRATFLPVVWRTLPDPVDFVRHLKTKAGWPATFWSPEIRVWRYATESFGERGDEESD